MHQLSENTEIVLMWSFFASKNNVHQYPQDMCSGDIIWCSARENLING